MRKHRTVAPAVNLPGTISESHDTGGEGVAYHDNEATTTARSVRARATRKGAATSGYNIGYTSNGEWMKYMANVSASGSYTFTVRAACPNGGCSLRVEVDGTDVTGTMNLATTGGWQTYGDTTKSAFLLSAGQHNCLHFTSCQADQPKRRRLPVALAV